MPPHLYAARPPLPCAAYIRLSMHGLRSQGHTRHSIPVLHWHRTGVNFISQMKKTFLCRRFSDNYGYLCNVDWGNPCPGHIGNKKRYAYLVDENLRNFQMSKDSIVVLTCCVSCYITTSARWVFSGPSSKTWLHGSSRFLC